MGEVDPYVGKRAFFDLPVSKKPFLLGKRLLPGPAERLIESIPDLAIALSLGVAEISMAQGYKKFISDIRELR